MCEHFFPDNTHLQLNLYIENISTYNIVHTHAPNIAKFASIYRIGENINSIHIKIRFWTKLEIFENPYRIALFFCLVLAEKFLDGSKESRLFSGTFNRLLNIIFLSFFYMIYCYFLKTAFFIAIFLLYENSLTLDYIPPEIVYIFHFGLDRDYAILALIYVF